MNIPAANVNFTEIKSEALDLVPDIKEIFENNTSIAGYSVKNDNTLIKIMLLIAFGGIILWTVLVCFSHVLVMHKYHTNKKKFTTRTAAHILMLYKAVTIQLILAYAVISKSVNEIFLQNFLIKIRKILA